MKCTDSSCVWNAFSKMHVRLFPQTFAMPSPFLVLHLQLPFVLHPLSSNMLLTQPHPVLDVTNSKNVFTFVFLYIIQWDVSIILLKCKREMQKCLPFPWTVEWGADSLLHTGTMATALSHWYFYCNGELKILWNWKVVMWNSRDSN